MIFLNKNSVLSTIFIIFTVIFTVPKPASALNFDTLSTTATSIYDSAAGYASDAYDYVADSSVGTAVSDTYHSVRGDVTGTFDSLTASTTGPGTFLNLDDISITGSTTDRSLGTTPEAVDFLTTSTGVSLYPGSSGPPADSIMGQVASAEQALTEFRDVELPTVAEMEEQIGSVVQTSVIESVTAIGRRVLSGNVLQMAAALGGAAGFSIGGINIGGLISGISGVGDLIGQAQGIFDSVSTGFDAFSQITSGDFSGAFDSISSFF